MNFKKVEQKWQKVWEKQGWYPAVDLDPKRKKLYVLVEFPYPSGSGLHVGHAFTMTGADVYARKKRMEGYNVLFPMGWDAFGLPTENYAVKTGIHPRIVTKRNTDNFRRQMKRMAFSFDWSREINTTDPHYYHWTQWIFIQLFKYGLAYKRKMPINWCPSCKIGLANEEVVNGKCERCGAEVTKKDLSQWIVKITDYADRLIEGLKNTAFIEKVRAAQINWIGRSEGARVRFPLANASSPRQLHSSSRPKFGQAAGECALASAAEAGNFLEVFTTRPDTLWGATFMVVAPEHWLVAALLNPKSQIPNSKKEEIRAYVEQARKKTELERTELEKDKTGVFTGLYALNPVNGKKIPIWISDFVLASYGTGAIMAVPAHDERDWQFAKKYNLPIVPVIKPEFAVVDVCQGETLELKLKEKVEKLLSHEEPYIESIGVLFNSGPWNGLRVPSDLDKIITYLEKKGIGQRAVSYHLRDWIFSRQHYWGEPIPMVYCPACAKKGITWWETQEGKAFLERFQAPSTKFQTNSNDQNSNDQNLDQFGIWNLEFGNSNPDAKSGLAGWFPIPEEELPLELPDVERYQPTGTGESPLAAIKEWVETKCPHCGGPARRETDTMPNWAGSDWYYLAYPIADKLELENSDLEFRISQNVFEANKNILRYWMPVDIYIGGDEHNTLHLLYSRFIYQFLWDIGAVPKEYPEPYYKRLSHGVILGPDGQKMSKSRGNVVNPDQVADQYGVDALRTYMMFMGPFEGTMAWNDNALRGVARFLRRFEEFIVKNLKRKTKSEKQQLKTKKLKVALNKLIKKVSDDIDKCSFNTAIAAMMEFLNQWSVTSDQWSVEDLKKLVQLIAPFAPYLAEELWHQLHRPARSCLAVAGGPVRRSSQSEGGALTTNHQSPTSVHLSPWPKPDPRYLVDEEVEIIVQVNGKLRAMIKVAADQAGDQKVVEDLAKKDTKVARYLEGKEIKKIIFVPKKLINFVI